MDSVEYRIGYKKGVTTMKLDDFIPDKGTVVMCFEPAQGLTIEKARELFEQVENESDLARIYVAVENKAWWISHDVYDFDEGTEEYEEISKISKAWFDLMKKIQASIYEILKSEGVEIPERGCIKVVEPFMRRNGYRDGNGWWIEDK